MLQLVQPIWLLALAGIAIPVTIHLWNQHPGKTLKVGSILLVKENTFSARKRIRLSEILLLLLRCLLLACMAIALAEPVWRRPANNASKGWVLINRYQLPSVYTRFKPQVDSLLQAGLEFHYFEDGFKQDKWSAALRAQTAAATTKQPSYRHLITLLNEQANSSLPLYVFTDNYLRNFSGNRLPVSLNLHWSTYTPDTGTAKITTGAAALQITIFSRAYTNDARYLKAALEAIQQFSHRKMSVTVVASVTAIPAKQDWLFWLDDEWPVAVNKAKNVLLYAKGKPVKCTSCILPAGRESFAAVDLYTSIRDTTKTNHFDTRWQDGFGYPLLSVQQQNNTAYYWLYTHFDPSWNELPWSDNFPAMVYKLLYTGTAAELPAGDTDNTIIDSTQLIPGLAPLSAATQKPVLFATTNLSTICWITVLILFFTERSFSFYRRKTNTGD